VVVDLHDVDVAGKLADIRFHVGRLRSAGAAASGEIARDDEVEVVELDEEADALGVQIVVRDGDRPAAQKVASCGETGGCHAPAKVDHLARRDGLSRDPGVTCGGDVVQVRPTRAGRRGRGSRRLHVGSVTVVVRDPRHAPCVQQLHQTRIVVDVVVSEHGVVDRGDSQRVEQRADLGAAPRRAAIDEQRLPRG
jgi:hypothetical protein